MLKHTVSLIHRLRILFLIVITVSFMFVLGLNPIDISVFIGAKMGEAVGMKISVPENPFNKLAAELKEKENRLSEREEELNDRELALARQTIAEQRTLIMVLAIGIVILFFLVIVNYILDFRRKKYLEIKQK